jgi:hypothetical protein
MRLNVSWAKVNQTAPWAVATGQADELDVGIGGRVGVVQAAGVGIEIVGIGK